MTDVIPGTFQITDDQFAARAFTIDPDNPDQTINFFSSQITGTSGLSITSTANSGPQAALFNPGEEYQLNWSQGGDPRSMLATVSRSDELVSGHQIVVFTGFVPETGQTFTMVMDLNGPVVPSNVASYFTNDRFDTTVGVCLADGSLVDTPDGPRPVEALRVGEMVLTLDHGPRPIRWIGRRQLGARSLAANPRLRPIRIRAGALAPGLPARDLRVSAQHRMLLRSRIAGRMYAADEVLVAAVHLTDIPGIDWDDAARAVEYFHLMFDRHEIIFAEGAPTESLYLGRMARQSLPDAALAELIALFPDLADAGHAPEPARLLVPGRRARKLAARHRDNARPLVS